MCGRYVLEGPVARLTEHFEARYTEGPLLFQNSYNIAPTTKVPVVRINRQGERVILNHQWGLIPSWSKDASVSAKLNNARAETVSEKPSFRTPFRRFRCLIPASGYYEWQAPPGQTKARKQPYYIYPSDAPYFAMAGICDHWKDPQGNLILSTAIITTEPCEELASIHDRMHVMIDLENWSYWLDPANQNPKPLLAMMGSFTKVRFHPVGFSISNVGQARMDRVELTSPLGEG